MTTLGLFLILAGLLIGSAIDAGADRFAREESWVRGRSRCRSCERRLRWFELVPVASWALARGRCRSCNAPIGWAAPVTELFGWTLLALAAIDFRTYLLPDALNAGVFLLGALMLAWTRPPDWPLNLAGTALGFGLLWLVETVYRHLRGRDGLGRGDAKLLGAVGLWVGAAGIPPVLLIASLTGIAAALTISLRSAQSLSGQSAIAFGPWIALGGYIVWLLQLARIPVFSAAY